MHINLQGKYILVTGASRGIGRAIALSLGQSGAMVAVHCRRHLVQAHAVARQIGKQAKVFQADLGKIEECKRLFQQVCASGKHLDILINNAGVALPAPLKGDERKWLCTWERTMALNLRAVAYLCRLAVEHFRKHGGGRIINVSSRAAFRGDTPDYLAYAASKGGLISLTRSLARAFGRDNIQAFLIAPGFVRTEMAQDFIKRYGEEIALKDIALSRLTEPEDVAPLVTFLASGLADHATGATFAINAGSYFH